MPFKTMGTPVFSKVKKFTNPTEVFVSSDIRPSKNLDVLQSLKFVIEHVWVASLMVAR